MNYDWAHNKLKLERAIAFCKQNGKTDEDSILKRYIALGGLVLKDTTEDAEEVPVKKTKTARKSKSEESDTTEDASE